jgi:hypothetical protein
MLRCGNCHGNPLDPSMLQCAVSCMLPTPAASNQRTVERTVQHNDISVVLHQLACMPHGTANNIATLRWKHATNSTPSTDWQSGQPNPHTQTRMCVHSTYMWMDMNHRCANTETCSSCARMLLFHMSGLAAPMLLGLGHKSARVGCALGSRHLRAADSTTSTASSELHQRQHNVQRLELCTQ